jgi:hypothetical protein
MINKRAKLVVLSTILYNFRASITPLLEANSLDLSLDVKNKEFESLGKLKVSFNWAK